MTTSVTMHPARAQLHDELDVAAGAAWYRWAGCAPVHAMVQALWSARR